MAQYLDAGLLGPTLKADLARDGEYFYKLGFVGSQDTEGLLLEKLATIWVKPAQFDKALLPKEADWSFKIDIPVNKAADYEPLIQRT
ncbi:MAG: hypothetical protein ACD_73C00627G0001, partial [uncultured bacterium]